MRSPETTTAGSPGRLRWGIDTPVVVSPAGRVVYRDEVATNLPTLMTALAKAETA